MGGVTGWVFMTWLKITVALGLGVGGVWLFTDRPGYVTAAVIAAGLIELWTVKALAREWAYEARTAWWWTS
ncbi:MAG: hypothetical protein M3Z25_01000 [Actinomycetota bacterium]|nr:hypothetical protein [Actinomycetota bacterium]